MPDWLTDELPTFSQTILPRLARPRSPYARPQPIDPEGTGNPFNPGTAGILPASGAAGFQPASPFGQPGPVGPTGPPPSEPAPLEVPEDKPGWLEYIAETLDKPGNALRSVLAGKPEGLADLIPFSQTLGLYDRHNRTSGQELNEKLFGIPQSDDFFSGPGLAGMATEVLADPLNLLPGAGGVKATTHAGDAAKFLGGHLAEAASIGERALLKAEQVAREAAKAKAAAEGLEVADKIVPQIKPLLHPNLKVPGTENPFLQIFRDGRQATDAEIAAQIAENMPVGNAIGDAARTVIANRAKHGIESLRPLENAGDRVRAGEEAFLSIGKHYDPLGLLRIGGKFNPLNHLPEIPVLTKGVDLPQKVLLEAPEAAQAVQDVWRAATDNPFINPIKQALSATGKVGANTARTLRELSDDARTRIGLGKSKAAQQAEALNEAIAKFAEGEPGTAGILPASGAEGILPSSVPTPNPPKPTPGNAPKSLLQGSPEDAAQFVEHERALYDRLNTRPDSMLVEYAKGDDDLARIAKKILTDRATSSRTELQLRSELPLEGNAASVKTPTQIPPGPIDQLPLEQAAHAPRIERDPQNPFIPPHPASPPEIRAPSSQGLETPPAPNRLEAPSRLPLTGDAREISAPTDTGKGVPIPKAPEALPPDLAGAKERFAYGAKNFPLEFESAIDRASYITARPKPSKRDADYLSYVMEKTGWPEEQVRGNGEIVRQRIRDMAKDARVEDGPLRIPASSTNPEQRFMAANPGDTKLSAERAEERIHAPAPAYEYKHVYKPGGPTLDDFQTAKQGSAVSFAPRDALSGTTRAESGRLYGSVTQIENGTATVHTPDGRLIPVPLEQLVRESGASSDYQKAITGWKREQIKRVVEGAADTRRIMLDRTQTPIVNMQANIEAAGRRDRLLEKLGLEGKADFQQAAALPKLLEDELLNRSVTWDTGLKSVEFVPAESIGKGGQIQIGGDTYTLKRVKNGLADLEGRFKVQYPADRIPRDRGTQTIEGQFPRAKQLRAPLEPAIEPPAQPQNPFREPAPRPPEPMVEPRNPEGQNLLREPTPNPTIEPLPKAQPPAPEVTPGATGRAVPASAERAPLEARLEKAKAAAPEVKTAEQVFGSERASKGSTQYLDFRANMSPEQARREIVETEAAKHYYGEDTGKFAGADGRQDSIVAAFPEMKDELDTLKTQGRAKAEKWKSELLGTGHSALSTSVPLSPEAEQLAQHFAATGKMAPDEARSLAKITDAAASAWADVTKRPAAEWFSTRFQDTPVKRWESAALFNEQLPAGIAKAKGNTGAVEFDKQGRALIHFFENGDIGTGIHEIGHILRRSLTDAELEHAAQWAGAKNAHGQWDKASEEVFARAFTHYVSTGNAPTPELQGTFAKLKEFLGNIWERIKSIVQDVPESRETFDKLLGKEPMSQRATPRSGKPMLESLEDFKKRPLNPGISSALDKPAARAVEELPGGEKTGQEVLPRTQGSIPEKSGQPEATPLRDKMQGKVTHDYEYEAFKPTDEQTLVHTKRMGDTQLPERKLLGDNTRDNSVRHAGTFNGEHVFRSPKDDQFFVGNGEGLRPMTDEELPQFIQQRKQQIADESLQHYRSKFDDPATQFAERAARSGFDARVVHPDDSSSRYVYLSRDGQEIKVRFSDHPQPTEGGKPVGGFSRELGMRHSPSSISIDPETGLNADQALAMAKRRFKSGKTAPIDTLYETAQDLGATGRAVPPSANADHYGNRQANFEREMYGDITPEQRAQLAAARDAITNAPSSEARRAAADHAQQLHERLAAGKDLREKSKFVSSVSRYLVDAGDKIATATEKAAQFAEGKSAATNKAIRDQIERNTAAAPEIIDIANGLTKKFEEALHAEQAAGLKSPELTGDLSGYFPHLLTGHGQAYIGKVIGKNEQLQMKFFTALEAKRMGVDPSLVMQGAEGLKPLQAQRMDRAIAQAGKRGQSVAVPPWMTKNWADFFEMQPPEIQQFLKREGIKSEFLDFTKAISTAHGNQIPRLAAFKDLSVSEINEIAKQHGAAHVIFNETVAGPYAGRMINHEKAMAAAEFFERAGKRLGKEMKPGEVKSIGPAGDGIIAGVTEQGEKVFGIEEQHTIQSNTGRPPIWYDSPEVAAVVRKMKNELTDPAQSGKLGQLWDHITGVYKNYLTRIFPAFHVRNAISNKLQSFLGGVPLSIPEDELAWKLLAGKDFKFTTPHGTFSADQLRSMVESHAVAQHGFFEDLVEGAEGATGRAVPASGLPGDRTNLNWNPFERNNKIVDLADRISSTLAAAPGALTSGAGDALKNTRSATIENQARIRHFMYRLREGMASSAAAADVNKYLFDYSGHALSDFEKNYGRRAVFFYNYTRNVIPLVAATAAESLNRIAQMTRLGIQPGKPAREPSYTKASLALPHGHDAEGNKELMYDLGTPVEAALEPFQSNPLNLLNPLAKVPLEVATGKDFFLGRDIADTRKAPHWLDALPESAAALFGRETIPGAPASSRPPGSGASSPAPTKTEMNPWEAFALRESPLSRLSNTASRLADTRKGPGDIAANLLFGPRSVSVDEEDEETYARKAEVKRRLRELEHQGRAREFQTFSAKDATGKKDAEAAMLLKELRR